MSTTDPVAIVEDCPVVFGREADEDAVRVPSPEPTSVPTRTNVARSATAAAIHPARRGRLLGGAGGAGNPA